MNRKQRRIAAKQDRSALDRPAPGQASDPGVLFRQAVGHQQQGQHDEAVRLYTRLLAVEPNNAEAQNNLACVLLAQGKAKEASARFERLLMLRPQLCDDFGSIAKLLADVNPALAEASRRFAQAGPNQSSLDLPGLSAVAADPLLRHVLRSTPVRSIELERFFTSVRRSCLEAATDARAGDRLDENVLDLCGALAQQCFINEYVFATTADEAEQAARLRERLANPGESPVPPLLILTVAMYVPLHMVPGAQSLLDRDRPRPVTDVLTQQVRQPLQERELRDSIPRLTTIDDAVSLEVQRQYEENPYPRWVHTPSAVRVTTINQHLRAAFPTASFRLLEKDGPLDILVAGCGTGRHPIEVARTYENARLLAVDLSLSSLSYAKRKTPADVAGRIEYAQGDILKLGTLDRSFDIVDASGVLHHMADPLAAWKTLLGLVRPNGFMRIALYSEIARRHINAARAFIAEKGYRATADDIRRCRQDLLNSPLKSVAEAGDFFSTSECRDLLFHVQERQLTIPDIKAFIVKHGLTFIGFEFEPPVQSHYRSLFSQAGWSTTDLDRWHDFETKNPGCFTAMYQFWVQKP